MNEFLEALIPPTKRYEKRIIAYLVNNPTESEKISNHYFSVREYKLIHQHILNAYIDKKPYDLEYLLESLRKVSSTGEGQLIFDFEYFKKLAKDFEDDDFVSILETMTDLEDNFLQGSLIRKLGSFFGELSDSESLTTERVDIFIDEVAELKDKIKRKDSFLTAAQLVEEYRKVLEDRENGIVKRSFGIREIDDGLIYPAEPGCFSLLVGPTGSGKSVFKKIMGNGLLLKHINVCNIDLEMPLFVDLDRMISMKKNIGPEKLLAQNKDQRLKDIINTELELFSKNPYYTYYGHPYFGLKDLDILIPQLKRYYYSLGVLPKDEYIFVFLDLLTMLTEFSGVSGSELETPCNTLNAICKKHNVHVCGIVQANENKLRARTKHFKDPSEIDKFQINKEDVKGGSALVERSRLASTIMRPLEMKKQYFPELVSVFEKEADVLHYNVIKKNLERNFLHVSYLMQNNFRMNPYDKEVHSKTDSER
jgi:energy-coupling factor transporter ATP-binding protein EcfA2